MSWQAAHAMNLRRSVIWGMRTLALAPLAAAAVAGGCADLPCESVGTASSADVATRRTVILVYGETRPGQDMFVRGGIDHGYAQSKLGRTCTAQNLACAIPIRHRNLQNATTAPWKGGDTVLDWYGAEAAQSAAAVGSPADWTTNAWPASGWGPKRTVGVDGFGEELLNRWGPHYWMVDVDMDCSATAGGWFEVKTYISNGPGWEPDVKQQDTPYTSINHMARCGMLNVFRRGDSSAVIEPLSSSGDAGVDGDGGGGSVCGNGVVERGEACDDGNTASNDGCSGDCLNVEPVCPKAPGACRSVCGDGILVAGEAAECDDGNTKDGDGCSRDCKIEPGYACTKSVGQLGDTMAVPVTFRDFVARPAGAGVRHPDFEAFSGEQVTANLVEPLLGDGDRPVYTGLCEGARVTAACPFGAQTTSKAAFDQWYQDDPSVNVRVERRLTLTRAGGEFFFPEPPPTTLQLFPLDGVGWPAAGRESLVGGHNFGFTSAVHYWFEYKGGETLTFSGDDDVWIFINRQLAVDLGGLHPRRTAKVTLDAATAARLKLEVGKVYPTHMFHAERHTNESNFNLTLTGFVLANSQCTGVCGDGLVVPGEQCDEGAQNGTGYGHCLSTCKLGPRCGDGIVNGPEECDDGASNGKPGSVCTSECRVLCGPSSETVDAVPTPIDLYLMLDATGSMAPPDEATCAVGSSVQGKWCYLINAIASFVRDPDQRDTRVAMKFFSSTMGSACDGSGYAVPTVPMSAVPASAATFIDALNATQPYGQTPTEAALRGIVGFTTAEKAPGRTMASIFVTDGEPTSCNQSPTALASILSAHRTASGIPTFVVGMSGASFSNLETLAVAGGAAAHTEFCSDPRTPCHYYDVAAGNHLAILSALKQIKRQAMACSFEVPKADAGVADLKTLQLGYTPGGASSSVRVPHVADKSQCTVQGGWYFDDAAAPRAILLCPTTCSEAGADDRGRLQITTACAP